LSDHVINSILLLDFIGVYESLTLIVKELLYFILEE